MSDDIIDTEKVKGGQVQHKNEVFIVGGESIGEGEDKIFIRHRNSNLSQLEHNFSHICNPGCHPLAILHFHLPKCLLESHMHGKPSQLVDVFQFIPDLWCKLSSHMCWNNSDRLEHWSQCLDAALRGGLLLPGFACTVFHTDAP